MRAKSSSDGARAGEPRDEVFHRVSEDLRDALGSSEHDALEFKEGLASRDRVRQAICALSNDLPSRGRGHLLIGVDDQGRNAGLIVDDDLLRSVAEFRDDARILPRPVMSVQAAVFDGKPCVQVGVTASPSPPVRFDGRVWVRIGPSSRVATREEERLLSERRRASELPFDQEAVLSSSLADLDLELFRSTYLPAAVSPDALVENQRTIQEQLASLRLTEPSGTAPTVLGLLLVGFDPSAWIPGAYLQFVRYEGEEEETAVQDQEELRGNLVITLDAVGRILATNIRTAVQETEGLRRNDIPDYPMRALRELVVNALTHRSYDWSNAPVRLTWFSNRVEITSPGGPFGVVTAENFAQRNDYRNPELAAAMKHLGYVDRFGRGITVVKRTLETNGNPPAEFAIEATYWSVTVRAIR